MPPLPRDQPCKQGQWSEETIHELQHPCINQTCLPTNGLHDSASRQGCVLVWPDMCSCMSLCPTEKVIGKVEAMYGSSCLRFSSNLRRCSWPQPAALSSKVLFRTACSSASLTNTQQATLLEEPRAKRMPCAIAALLLCLCASLKRRRCGSSSTLIITVCDGLRGMAGGNSQHQTHYQQ